MGIPGMGDITGGDLLSFGGSLYGQHRANTENAARAHEQMAFQAEMSNTAHRREVQDLIAAGLNPILSASKGASTPPGAMPVMHDAVTPAINSALASRRNRAEVNLMNSQAWKNEQEGALASTLQNKAMAETALVDEQRWKATMEQVLVGAQAVRESASAEELEATAANLRTQYKILQEELKAAVRRGSVDETQYGQFMEYVNRMPGVGSILSGVAGGALVETYRQRNRQTNIDAVKSQRRR